MRRPGAAALVLGAVVAAGAAGSAALAGPSDPTLAVRDAQGRLDVWWRAAAAPAHWAAADARLAAMVAWKPAADGVEWAELPIAGGGEARAIRLILVRIDPALAPLAVVWGVDAASGRPAWTIDRAPPGAAVAVNAGMFVGSVPWGWLVLDGREVLPPGTGPLSSALVIRRDGRVAWVDGDDLAAWRGRPDVAFAFQSYPSLLVGDGDVPAPLRTGAVINRRHRDARLTLGLDAAGRLLVVLTRLDVAVPGADRLPFGLTVPEMAAVMGGLGARRAMLLDGGISAQLLVRDAANETRRWPGLRPVPLALLAGPGGAR